MGISLDLVHIIDSPSRNGILSPGDVEVTPERLARAMAELSAIGDDPAVALELGDLASLREVLPNLIAPYKRVVLSASHVHARRKKKSGEEQTNLQHVTECLRQHRIYFRRRGVATSLEIDPRLAFGDKGVTGTANDRDVFLAFMKRIGLEDAVSPNAVAAQVIKAVRDHQATRGQSEAFYGALFQAMSKRPGQNLERRVFDEVVAGTPLQPAADQAYQVLCDLTRRRYEAINEAITRAHTLLQISLTLEKEGIARFTLNNPFGLAIPYPGSLFRLYELNEAQHTSRVIPTFFTLHGGLEDDDEFEILAVSGGGFGDLEGVDRFRVGEVYVPVTVEQLAKVGQFALEHCNFDVAVVSTDSAQALGTVLDGSGGAIRRVTRTFDPMRDPSGHLPAGGP